MPMQIVPPIVILIGLGVGAGVIFHLRWSRFWLASLAAAISAGIVWVAGGSLLFWLVAPNELGPPLPGQVAEILLTTLAAAVVAGWVMRGQRAKPVG
jgi:hypothetical protein